MIMQGAITTTRIPSRDYYSKTVSASRPSGRYKKVAVTKAETKGMRRFKLSLLVLFFALLIMALLYSNAQLTEQVGEIEKLGEELLLLESEYAYQSFDMERRTSLNEVEEYAIRELGLIKNDNSRIEYIHLNSENELRVSEEPMAEWQQAISQNFMSILEYLRP